MPHTTTDHHHHHFKKGDKVEVSKNDDHNSSINYFPATVVLRPNIKDQTIYVEYQNPTSSDVESAVVREYVKAGDVRPAPVQDLHRFFKVGEEVEVLYENGWRRGRVRDIMENSKYLVAIHAKSECEIEFDQWMLRLPRHWVSGHWVVGPPPPPQVQSKSPDLVVKPRVIKFRIRIPSDAKFSKGTMVEVCSDKEGYQGSWYAAVVIGLVGNNKFLVEYQTLKTNGGIELLKEEANVSCVRPCPPGIQRVDRYEQHEQVDAWYNNGWWVGHISKVLNDLKYLVIFKTTTEEMILEHCKLRPHQEWIEGRWVAASKISMPDFEFKSKEDRFKIKYSRRKSEAKFSKGMMVEVKSDEEGYQGSWYTAVIVDSIGNEKILVEYQTLKTDDESELLKETTDMSYVRPCPPEIQQVYCFKMLEEVDAWYNEGWWVGIISKVLDGTKYAVYFWNTNEELEFEHCNLRPHQEWLDGKWVLPFRKKSEFLMKWRPRKLKRKYKGKTSEAKFSKGTKVEVRSDEEGYQGSWYPAVIVGPVGHGKYLVEYLTLKTDDGTELLKEEADALCMRPCPPVMQQADRFEYLQMVDAWFNDGWWIGQVFKVLEGSKYTIYFRTTAEAMEFQHSYLRPHQEWIDGKWI